MVTNIVGIIKDSGGFPLTGKLTITLDAPINDEATVPDSYYSTEPHDYPIALGVVNIPLLESASSNVTYYFQFFKAIPGGYDSAKPEFHAIVPDAETYEWNQLANQTGISTAALDTSAVRVAREILANDTLKPLVASSLGFFRQSAKPVAIGTFDYWVKTPENTTWTWDASTSKWLSQPFFKTLEIKDFTGASIVASGALDQIFEYTTIRLQRIQLCYSVANPNTITNRWSIKPGIRNVGSASFSYYDETLSNAVEAGTRGFVTYSPDLGINLSALELLALNAVATGSPGALNASATFIYKIIHS